MNIDFNCYVSPVNRSELKHQDNQLQDGSRIYRIVNRIPRFVPSSNYSDSFGFQWKRFRQTQLDSYSRTAITHDRFYSSTGWNEEDLQGKKILEVGSGAGRFTEVVLKSGAYVYSVEYSEAVDANYLNNGSYPNLSLCQASVYELPFRHEFFDYVFCMGVLQHTPDVKKAFMSMVPFLKQGGQIAVDVYPFNWKTIFYTKYWLRPLTKRIRKDILLNWVSIVIPKWFPISTALLHVPLIGKFLAQLIPICNYSMRFPQLTNEQLVEWAILDTFDMLSPEFDRPIKLGTLKSWFREAGLEILFAGRSDNGYGAVGRKKKSF